MFRRAMKRAVANALRAGAEGVKIKVSGRLGELRSLVASGTAKAAFLCTRLELTSTMG